VTYHPKRNYRDAAVHKDRWLFRCDCGETFEFETALRYHRRGSCPLNRTLPAFMSKRD